MTPASLLEQVKDVASDVLGVPASSLKGDSSPDTIESWDSVQHLSLVMALEQRFGVSIDPADVEKMRTLESVAQVIARKLAR